MTNLGEVFKQVRQSRRLTLKDAAGADYSTSMLSRFENGQADITSQKLLDCLDNIYLTAEELYRLANNLQPSYFDQLRLKVREFSSPFNQKGLEDLLAREESRREQKLSKFHQLNTIWLKAVIMEHDPDYALAEKDIDTISAYLFSVDYWGNYEREIIVDLMMVLPLPLYYRYCLEMIKHTTIENGASPLENRLHTSLIHGLYQATEQNNKELGEKFIALIDKHFSTTRDAYMRMMTMIAKGLYYKIHINKAKGQSLLVDGINLLNRLGYHDIAGSYQHFITMEEQD